MDECDFNKLIAALSTAPAERSNHLVKEIKDLLELTEGMKKLHQDLDSPYLAEVCAGSMELCTYAPNEFIVQAGIYQRNFSLMLSGIGSVVIPSHLISLKVSGKRPSDAKIRQNFASRLGLGTLLSTQQTESSAYKLIIPGDGIGFNSFQKVKTNLFSVASKTHSITANISSSILKEFIEKQNEELQLAKLDFIKTLPGFGQFTGSYITRLARDFNQKTYSINQIIYREGSKCECIYAIKSGLVEFSKEAITKGISKKLYIKSVGDIFGEHEMLANSTRTCTAMSSSNSTILYSLSAEIFKELVSKTKLASHLALRSQELQAFYSSREHKPLKSERLPRKLSAKLSKSYSRYGATMQTKLLENLNRKYENYTSKGLQRSVSPSTNLRNTSPFGSDKPKVINSPIKPDFIYGDEVSPKSPSQQNDGNLLMSTKSVKAMLREVRDLLFNSRPSSTSIRGIRTANASPNQRLRNMLERQ